MPASQGCVWGKTMLAGSKLSERLGLTRGASQKSGKVALIR